MSSKVKIESVTDRLVAQNGNRTDGSWQEGDEAFPEEIEIVLWRRTKTKYLDGHQLVDSAIYRRVDAR